jgi:two-component system response regulator MprA
MRVLVVEDDPAAREATQRYLQFCGYKVATASTAAEALQLSSQFRPQVIVCDCKLGDSNDGIDVARQIQGQLGSIVIFVTAWSFKDIRDQFHGIDVTECLRKPVRLGKLADVIRASDAH